MLAGVVGLNWTARRRSTAWKSSKSRASSGSFSRKSARPFASRDDSASSKKELRSCSFWFIGSCVFGGGAGQAQFVLDAVAQFLAGGEELDADGGGGATESRGDVLNGTAVGVTLGHNIARFGAERF